MGSSDASRARNIQQPQHPQRPQEQIVLQAEIESEIQGQGDNSLIKQLQAFFALLSEYVVVCDTAGRIMYLNDTAMEAFEVRDIHVLLGKVISNLGPRYVFYDMQHLPLSPQHSSLAHMLRGEHKATPETVFLRIPSGQELRLQVSGIPLYDAQQNMIACICLLRDSSMESHTIQELEQTLLKTRKRFESFISAAGHELRTPLTTIKGNAQLVLRRLEKLRRKAGQQEQVDASVLGADLERLQQPLDYIVYRVNEQDKMISDLLDVSRVQSGKISIIMRPCNLVKIVQNAVQNAHEAAMDRIIDLTIPEEVSQISIHADPERIEQALNALLSNAMKYSMPDRPVKVALTLEEREASPVAQVQVQDYGTGIPADELENIWEISYRVKGIEVQDGSSVGLGLGLFLCRALIERQQGTIEVSSVPGEGSRFWFTLPLAQAAEES